MSADSPQSSRRVGVFVGDQNWSFFKEIYADLQRHHRVTSFVTSGPPLPVFKGRLSKIRNSRAMNKLLAESDVCLFEWASDLLVKATSERKRCPIVARLHSYELLFWGSSIDWSKVDRVILVSHAMKSRFAELYPDHAHKAVVVYNGVDLDRFQPRVDGRFDFRVGMLANLHPVKRIYDMVLSIYALRQQGYPATLHIGGAKIADGHFDTYHGAILSAIRRLHLDDAVVWDGHVADAPSWLRTMDIFVSNSYWEGQQVALIEAMASGCLCLSHFWEGAEEVVPRENIFVTEQDLHARIIALANATESQRQSRRAEARQIASDRFDARHQHAEFRRVLDETLNGATS